MASLFPLSASQVDEAVCEVLEEALENEDLRGRAQILRRDVAEAGATASLSSLRNFMSNSYNSYQ